MKKVGSLDQRGNLDIFGLLLTDVWLSHSHPDSGVGYTEYNPGCVSHFEYPALLVLISEFESQDYSKRHCT